MLNSRFLGALLLVSGTTIGAGMLALPVSTGQAGFIPALLLMGLIWLLMLASALYFIELQLQLPQERNLISMTKKTLGPAGAGVAWVLYLFLLYALSAAYLLGASQILAEFIFALTSFRPPDWLGVISIYLFFALFLYFGIRAIDYINRLLMAGLFIAFFSLMGLGLGFIDLDLLWQYHWDKLPCATTVIVASFGYHVIIPTLTRYLHNDIAALRRAVLIGSAIPFAVYLCWQLLVMGIVPIEGLCAADLLGLPATLPLQDILQHPWLNGAARSFAFFAIITSLLGVSLSLTDFLADGLNMVNAGLKRGFLIFLALTPPLIFAIFYPTGFILAVSYAGFCVIILLLLLPTIMLYYTRYRLHYDRGIRVAPGGKKLLLLVLFLGLTLLALEVLGWY